MYRFTPKNRLSQYFERWQTPTDCLPEFGMGKRSQTKESVSQAFDDDLAEMFRRNITESLKLYSKQKLIGAACNVGEAEISRWKSRGVGVRKITAPIARYCQVLGIDPESMWEPKFKRVGPVIVEAVLDIKPYRPID